MTEQVEVALTSWNRFYTRNLAVSPELLGQSHEFTFEEHEINISLPSAERLEDDETRDRVLSVESWEIEPDGRERIRAVNVHKADVRVNLPNRVSVPEGALTRPINAFELFPKQQRDYLNGLASDYSNVASQAFDLWTRTLRWKADDYQIGLPEVSSVESGWGTHLEEKNTQKAVWAPPRIFVVRGGKTVTAEIWDEVPAVLNSGGSPPIYYDLLYDAIAHLERGDLQRTVVDAAVAAEVYMRSVVQENLPCELSDRLGNYINEAPIRKVIENFFAEALNKQQTKVWKRLSKDLHKLFNSRNDIMHSGRAKALTEERCQKFIKSVEELLLLVPYKSV